MSLARPPEARAETVDDLIAHARAGRLRIPNFQRGLKWQAAEVLELFDSVYRGLPIGSLLLWKKAAPAERVRLGPLAIDAPEMSDAWYVVDGQQRVTSLITALSRPWPPPADADDPFRVMFDAKERRFVSYDAQGSPPPEAVPVPKLLDATELSEWVLEWPYKELRGSVFEAGKRLREYRVPLAIVHTEDPEVLREIFHRVNNSGKRLDWSEVHDALFGHKGAHPGTLSDLAAALAPTRFGTIDEAQLMTCLLAIRGLDVTRSLGEHLREDRRVLEDAVAPALPVLERVISFLRGPARIPHERLLPRGWILEPLARFFHLHPSPARRNVELLVRWLWRLLVTAKHREDRVLRRQVVGVIDADETETIQALLELIPRKAHPIPLPDRFDARAADSRVVLLALSSLGPRSLFDGSPLDVAAVMAAAEAEAFARIFPSAPDGPANRAIHPPAPSLSAAFKDRARSSHRDAVLMSHAIDASTAQALADGDADSFGDRRRARLAEVLSKHAERMCGWARNDRDRPALRGGSAA